MTADREQPIEAILGAEPMTANARPSLYHVRQSLGGGLIVSRIVFREDNFGDHGLGWFDVYAGEQRVRSMSARHIAEIIYQVEPKA